MVSALIHASFGEAIDTASDAVPKKRGPKTDVLEALVKRVDGLEKQLRHEQDDEQAVSPTEKDEESANSPDLQPDPGPPPKRQRVETSGLNESASFSSSSRRYYLQSSFCIEDP